MEPYSDLDGILRGWLLLKVRLAISRTAERTIATYEIGELVLTSGQLLGCDPAHHDGEVI